MDDHPARGPHTECLVDHGGQGVPRHCTRGCAWPCPEASEPLKAAPDQLWKNTVCGLQLEGGLEEGETPLEAIIVVKYLTAEGNVAYTPYATPELTTVEALGMLGHADRKLRYFEEQGWEMDIE